MSRGDSSGSAAPPAATTGPVHGIVGSLEPFHPNTDMVAAYVERAELYMDANGTPEAKRVATFLNGVGKTTYAIIRNLMIPEKPAEKSLKDIIAVMEKHFEPKPLVISERFKFNKRMQLPSETVSEYVAELRKLSEHCKFEAFLDDALRDRFVCGLRSEATQKKLLLEAELNFAKAIDIAQGMEVARDNWKQMQSPTTAVKPAALDVQRLEKTSCYRCGQSSHAVSQCPYKNSKCHKCGKIGHLKRACLSKLGGAPGGPRNFRKKKKNVRTIEEDLEGPIDNIKALNKEQASGHKPYNYGDCAHRGKTITDGNRYWSLRFFSQY